MTDDDLEQLREQSERGSRLQDDTDPDSTLTEEITVMLSEIEDGDRTKTIAVRDQPMAALLAALDQDAEAMTEVGQALQDTLDRDPSEEFDRSEIARLLMRVGLQQSAPDRMSELQDAIAEHTRQRM